VYVGETDTLWIPCGNLAFDWLTLTPTFDDTTDFSPVPPVPWEIDPYDTIAVGVLFHPSVEGMRTAVLTLASDDPNHPQATVRLEGVGLLNSVAANPFSLPTRYRIASIYPNPFNDSAQVTVELPRNDRASLKLVDLIGRVVRDLGTNDFPAGTNSLSLSAKGVPSGVYFLTVEFGSGPRLTRKMVHVK
jgi:hypothetical protein